MNYPLERIVIAAVIVGIMALLTRLTFMYLCYTPYGARIRLRNIKKRYVCFIFLLTVLSIMFLIWSLFDSSLTGTERIILSSLSVAVLSNFYSWRKTPAAESFPFIKTVAYYWPAYNKVPRPKICTSILRDDGVFYFPREIHIELALLVYMEYLSSIGITKTEEHIYKEVLQKEGGLVYKFTVVAKAGIELIAQVVLLEKNRVVAFGLDSTE